jgi:hypothetical protein
MLFSDSVPRRSPRGAPAPDIGAIAARLLRQDLSGILPKPSAQACEIDITERCTHQQLP